MACFLKVGHGGKGELKLSLLFKRWMNCPNARTPEQQLKSRYIIQPAHQCIVATGGTSMLRSTGSVKRRRQTGSLRHFPIVHFAAGGKTSMKVRRHNHECGRGRTTLTSWSEAAGEWTKSDADGVDGHCSFQKGRVSPFTTTDTPRWCSRIIAVRDSMFPASE